MTGVNRQALAEIRAHALDLGDDEIAADCAEALAGDREALGYIQLDTETRAEYARWRAL